MARRIAWRRAVEPAFVFARMGPPIGPWAASTVLSTAASPPSSSGGCEGAEGRASQPVNAPSDGLPTAHGPWSTTEGRTTIAEEEPLGACPICLDAKAPEHFDTPRDVVRDTESFGYLLCHGCGAMRIASIPADLAPYYPAEYYEAARSSPPNPHRGADRWARPPAPSMTRPCCWAAGNSSRAGRGGLPHPRRSEVRRISAFTRRAGLHSFDDPILDVGCGRRATNLASLRRLGFRQLLGIDPFLEGDGEFVGIPLRRRSIEEQSGSFQAITFHHSFEHVPDPEATLAAAARRLRPGGVLLIRTPVMGTWFWEHFGTAWWELDPPGTCGCTSSASLELLAGRAGLALVDVVWDSSYLEIIASEQIAQGRRVARTRIVVPRSAGRLRCRDDRPVPVADRGTQQRGPRRPCRFLLPPQLRRRGRAARLDRRGRGARRVTPVGRAGVRWRANSLARGVRGFVAGPPPPSTPSSPADRPPGSGPGIRELVRASPRASGHDGFRVNLIVPSVGGASSFGGVQTALDLFHSVAGGEGRRRVISVEGLDASIATSFPEYRVVETTDDSDDPAQLVSLAPGPLPALVNAGPPSIPIGPRDVFIATFWPTALFALEVRDWQTATFGAAPPAFAYLVQDFEPGFYPRSAQSVLSSSTYDAPGSTIAIFNTALLQREFHAAGLRFASEFSFEPRLSPPLRAVLTDPAGERSRTIVVYGRPSKPRNGFGLIVDGLRAWRAATPGAADWRVVSAGEPHPDVDLGGGVVLRSLGKLSMDAYADLLRQSAIGISLMFSAHPSYPPLEMSYLGLLVLTNTFGEKDLSTWHPNIASLTSAEAQDLASDLAALCGQFESDASSGDRARPLVTDFLATGPQFPFAGELATLLEGRIGHE